MAGPITPSGLILAPFLIKSWCKANTLGSLLAGVLAAAGAGAGAGAAAGLAACGVPVSEFVPAGIVTF